MTDLASRRRMCIFEVVLLLLLAFGQSLTLSLIAVFMAHPLFPADQTDGPLRIAVGLVQEAAVLALLVYVLARNGRTLQDLGFSFVWKDLPRAAALIVVTLLLDAVVYYALTYSYYAATSRILNGAPRNIGFMAGAAVGWHLPLYLTFSVLNPFFEELIVRAYFIREVVALGIKPWLAVCISSGFQAAYHLYQGVVPAACYFFVFAVFSIYFLRSGRIMPVILAHMCMDVAAMFQIK